MTFYPSSFCLVLISFTFCFSLPFQNRLYLFFRLGPKDALLSSTTAPPAPSASRVYDASLGEPVSPDSPGTDLTVLDEVLQPPIEDQEEMGDVDNEDLANDVLVITSKENFDDNSSPKSSSPVKPNPVRTEINTPPSLQLSDSKKTGEAQVQAQAPPNTCKDVKDGSPVLSKKAKPRWKGGPKSR